MKITSFIIVVSFFFVPLVLSLSPPLLSSSVTDLADLLSPQAEYELQQLIADIEKNTTAEIAILTVPSFDGMSKEEFTTEVFEQNNIGKKAKDNGLLIVVSRDDREYRVEVGYGLEQYVTDAKKVDIGVRILEYYFKQEQYDAGMLAAVRAVYGLIQGQEDVFSSQRSSALSFAVIILFVILLIVVLLLGKYGLILFPPMIPGQRRSGGWGGGVGGSSGGFGGGSSGGGGFGGRY